MGLLDLIVKFYLKTYLERIKSSMCNSYLWIEVFVISFLLSLFDFPKPCAQLFYGRGNKPADLFVRSVLKLDLKPLGSP
jgi:hypothetical protein